MDALGGHYMIFLPCFGAFLKKCNYIPESEVKNQGRIYRGCKAQPFKK